MRRAAHRWMKRLTKREYRRQLIEALDALLRVRRSDKLAQALHSDLGTLAHDNASAERIDSDIASLEGRLHELRSAP